jgi:hypothetical protein
LCIVKTCMTAAAASLLLNETEKRNKPAQHHAITVIAMT